MAKALTPDQISEIKRKVANQSLAAVAKEYNVSTTTIRRWSMDENSPLNQQSSIRKPQVNLSVQQKDEILKKLEMGESSEKLALEYNVNSSTIRRIRTDKSKILKRVLDLKEGHGNLESKKIRVEESNRDKALFKWFEQERAQGTPVSGDLLRAKALQFHKISGDESEFKASNGWLDNFKRRYGIRQLSMQGEKLSANNAAAEQFKTTLQQDIRENYELDQVYNADETGLYFKSLPRKTLAAASERQASGFKEQKDRVTVMCCANASGTHKITPLIIGKSKNPHCFKKVKKENLPVKYMNNKSAWMDKKLFMQWFKEVFIPEVKEKHGGRTKVLLLLDNAPSHPAAEDLNAVDSAVQVVFLPPNVTALIQPMDQGVIEKMKKTFKSKMLLELVMQHEEDNIIELAKKQNVKDCCLRISSAWDLLTERDIQNSWKRILGIESTPYEPEVSVHEANQLLKLLKVCPEYANCTREMAEAWIKEDYHDNGWEVLDVDEIYRRYAYIFQMFDNNHIHGILFNICCNLFQNYNWR